MKQLTKINIPYNTESNNLLHNCNTFKNFPYINYAPPAIGSDILNYINYGLIQSDYFFDATYLKDINIFYSDLKYNKKKLINYPINNDLNNNLSNYDQIYALPQFIPAIVTFLQKGYGDFFLSISNFFDETKAVFRELVDVLLEDEDISENEIDPEERS